jgi:hypothetical protein
MNLLTILHHKPSKGGTDQLAKRKKGFFNPDTITAWPIYPANPLKSELTSIINEEGYVPFHIESANRTEENEKRSIQFKGHYMTYDGVRVTVIFRGDYGSIEHPTFLELVTEKDCFSNINLEVLLESADPAQLRVFENIKMRDEWIHFRNGKINYKFKDEFLNHTAAGLAKVRKIGKAISFYNYAHTEECMEQILMEKGIFSNEIEGMGLKEPKVGMRIVEFTLDADRNRLIKMFNDSSKEFFGGIEFDAHGYMDIGTNEAEGIVAVGSLMDGKYAHNTSFTYIPNHKSWKIGVHDKIFKSVVYAVNMHTKVSEEIHWVKYICEFIYGAMNIYNYDPICTEDDIEAHSFTDSLLEARERLRKKDASYQPIYPTLEEGCIYNENTGNLTFKSKASYLLFKSMMGALVDSFREGRKLTADDIMTDLGVKAALGMDEHLQRTVTTFYSCFKKDPNNAASLQRQMDPAYKLAEQIYDEKYVKPLE